MSNDWPAIKDVVPLNEAVVDLTPDEELPLRILRTFRDRCNATWEVSGFSDSERRIWDLMNQHQRERAEILDRAIARFTGGEVSR